MTALYLNKKDCCGCFACGSICSQSAISMRPDKEGFLYPEVDKNKCKECGYCKKVCVFQKKYTLRVNKNIQVYAVKHVSSKVRNRSSSGGIFTAISDEILFHKGTVYGVGYDEKMVACHQRATDKNARDNFRGSKYVQSEIRQTLKHVQDDLENGLSVLFTGTPCQIAAVKEYIKRKHVNAKQLILCDVVCHGTPSPKIFSEYLKYAEILKGKKLVNHVCRSKNLGWHRHTEMNIFEDGEEDFKSQYSQVYKALFYGSIILRPCCHNCKYTNLSRQSDLTMADYWGIEKCFPGFDDNKGVSLLLVNTVKGQKMFENVCSNIVYVKSNIKDCLQPQLQFPAKASPIRGSFWMDYYNRGFIYVIGKYAGYSISNRIIKGLKSTFKKIGIIGFIKKIRNLCC